MKRNIFLIEQVIPIGLTVVIFAVLCAILYVQIRVLNIFSSADIVLQLRWVDIVVGATIYLKTSVDFAIFIGNLMSSSPGWRNRIAIEIGTAVGNALGTLIVLTIWNFFREIAPLLAAMVFVASLVLLRLAQDGLEHAVEKKGELPQFLQYLIAPTQVFLTGVNRYTGPFLKILIPHASMKPRKAVSWLALFTFAFTVPFILGLDDFAGYVPVFNIVNVFGFAVGVFAGHMILNILLFVSPHRTIAAVKNPIISLLGTFAFIALSLWGFWEVGKLLLGH